MTARLPGGAGYFRMAFELLEIAEHPVRYVRGVAPDTDAAWMTEQPHGLTFGDDMPVADLTPVLLAAQVYATLAHTAAVVETHAGGRVSDYGLIATAGVLAALPPVLIGLVMQRALISGLTSGGVKG